MILLGNPRKGIKRNTESLGLEEKGLGNIYNSKELQIIRKKIKNCFTFLKVSVKNNMVSYLL